MSEYDNFDNFDVMDQELSNVGVAVPDKKDRNPEKKEKESSGMKPGKGKTVPGRSKPADKDVGVVTLCLCFTKREYMLLRLTSAMSRKSMSAIVRELMSHGFKKMEIQLSESGIFDLEKIIDGYNMEF